MSSRFHQKYHRSNHHSIPFDRDRSDEYPDAGYDPIASFDHPFKGEFFSQGNIITTRSLSADRHLLIGLDAIIGEDLTVKHDAVINNDLSVYGETALFDANVVCLSSLYIENDLHVRKNIYGYGNLALTGVAVIESHLLVNNLYNESKFQGDLKVEKDLTVTGNLIVEGDSTMLYTNAYVTSSVEIQNRGTSAGLKVTQEGNQPIARFIDAEGGETTIGNNAVITAPAIILTAPHVHRINPTSSILLPLSAIDVELAATNTVSVSSFTGGVRGITYTLTNTGTANVTLTANSKLYIRGGRAWRSNTYSMSSAFLQLNPKHSCSVRVGNNGEASVW